MLLKLHEIIFSKQFIVYIAPNTTAFVKPFTTFDSIDKFQSNKSISVFMIREVAPIPVLHHWILKGDKIVNFY